MHSENVAELAGWATVVSPPTTVGGSTMLVVDVAGDSTPGLIAGRFFQVRCNIDSESERFTAWNHYAPCTLFAVEARAIPVESMELQLPPQDMRACQHDAPMDTTGIRWTLLLPPSQHPCHAWLSHRSPGDRILCFGPYGNPRNFAEQDTRHHLLVVADSDRILALLSEINRCLDRGGKVTVLLLRAQTWPQPVKEVIQALPLQVEIQELQNLEPSDQLVNLVRWADLMLTAVENRLLPQLAYNIKAARFQAPTFGRKSSDSQQQFAYALVEADYLCGYGACLACTVPTAGGGLTRACLHGPILPLSILAG